MIRKKGSCKKPTTLNEFLLYIKRTKFTNNNDCEIDGKTNLYSYCIDCGFKKLETIDKEEVSDLLKSLKYT